MGYGDGPVAAVLLAIALTLLTYVAVRPPASPEAAAGDLPVELAEEGSTA
jgi:hypothetical protein